MIHVQSEMAGVLIGKGGDTINTLRRDSGASINVSRDEAQGNERAVTIRGTKEAIDKAVKGIEEIIEREKGRSRREEKFEEREESDEDRDEAKKVMYVSGTFVGMIIGRGGESIKAMSRESGARIEVSKDDLGDRDADRTVTILGTQDAVDKASRMIEDIVSRSEEEPHFGPAPWPRTVEAPPGFEECEQEEWLYNPSTKEYFSKKSGALAWLNDSGIFCPIREGVKHSDLQPVTAGTAVLSAANGGAVPKTVVIPDLHRVAMALKLPLDHVDSPCAMLAVFGGSEPQPAAMNFHEKLLRRISSWRSVWMEQAWLVAMNAAMMDLAGSGPLPVMAAALQMGPRLVCVASPGAHLALSGAPPPLVTEGGSGAFALLQRGETETPPPVLVALVTGCKAASLTADTSRSLLEGRPRAAALHLAKSLREAGETGHLATACARLSFVEENPLLEKKVAEKKPKLEEKLNKVRVRQILIRFWSGKGPHPMNPVARKPVLRKLDEAELLMLEILEKLLAQKCQNFPQLCKASSECGSALKGGADNGDLGWLDQAKVAALARAKGQPLAPPSSAVQSSVPVAVVKTAFALKKGELSDLVVSEVGVHLVQRTG